MTAVLAVASEAFPLIKTGGLADVVGALPAALARQGVAVRTLLPGYPAVMAALHDGEAFFRFDDLFGGPATLIAGEAKGLDVIAIDAPHLYARPGNPYVGPDGRDWPDNVFRFAALGKVAAEIGRGAAGLPAPDVVHLHDWQAGLAPAYLAFGPGPRPKTVATIHNIAFQGWFPASLLGALGLPDHALTIDGVEYFGGIGFLKAALLSRCRVHVLEGVSPTDIVEALERALGDRERGLGEEHIEVAPELLLEIATAADGDVRRALTLLEIAAELAGGEGGRITPQTLTQVLADRTRRFDKGGEQFYDQISALHKSVRSSNPDAALYWLTRMLDGGCDPSYLARRLTRMAIEDIGLADPRAQSMALEAWDIYERLGSPEGELAFAQLVLYLASTAKSNAGYAAFNQAKADVRDSGTEEVPLHLRNAPTKLMKELGYGAEYQYDHDAEGGIALDQTGFPDAMGERVYYNPVPRGLEIKLKEKLDRLRAEREAARAAKGA